MGRASAEQLAVRGSGSNMPVTGLILCSAWYYTILAGFYTLYCPVTYLMFFNHKLYRKVVDYLFALWELYPVALFECCFNCKVHYFGDHVNPDESTILIMNHRTRVDWNYVWLGLYHACAGEGKAKTKFVLKDEIKNIPGLGWIMQLNFFLYVKRNWLDDQIILSQFVDYYRSMRNPCRVVLFPEGTDLSANNKRKSDDFATNKNLPKYDYVLHPRTTGFVALCTRMRAAGLASVYDVSVAYDRPAQTETDLLRGHMPAHAYFHIKRYPINELPTEEEYLKTWLNDKWREKEFSLKKFYMDGTFIESVTNKAPVERAPRTMRKAKLGCLFWTLIDALFTYGLLTSTIIQFWVLYHSLLFMFVTWYLGGFHSVQYKLLTGKY